MYEADETMRACAHSVNVLVGVHVVKRHASGEVRCNVVISVVIGVHVLFLVPLVQFLQYVSIFLACRTVTDHPTLSRSHSFTYVFTVFIKAF